MAFKVAAALGCNPIILIGQDLAYSRDGKTHAKDNTYGEKEPRLTSEEFKINMFEVMGNDGLPIMTNEDWHDFRKGYELDLKEYEGICINATEGGAYIEGTEIMTFAKAIEGYVQDYIFPLKIVRESIACFKNDDAKVDLENVKNIIDQTMEDLIKMQNICRKSYDIITENRELYKGFMDIKLNDYTKEQVEIILNGYNEVLKNKVEVMTTNPTMSRFLMHIIQPYYIKTELDLNELGSIYEDESKVKIQVYLRHERWFAIYHEIISICISFLRDAKERLNKINI
jgi:hypothetical protein